MSVPKPITYLGRPTTFPELSAEHDIAESTLRHRWGQGFRDADLVCTVSKHRSGDVQRSSLAGVAIDLTPGTDEIVVRGPVVMRGLRLPDRDALLKQF